MPTLSYGSAFAAVAITACLSLSQDVQVTQVDGQSKLTFRNADAGSFLCHAARLFRPGDYEFPQDWL